VIGVREVELVVGVGRDVAREGAGQEDRGQNDEAADGKAVAQEAAAYVCPLAAGLDLQARLVSREGLGRRQYPAAGRYRR
jgi:hypothetical protein